MKKIIEIKNFLTDTECDDIMKIANKFEFSEATTVYSNSNFNVDQVDQKFRQSKIAYIKSTHFPELTRKVS